MLDGGDPQEGDCRFCTDPAARTYRFAALASAWALLMGAAGVGMVGWFEQDGRALPAFVACMAASGIMLWAALHIRPNHRRCCVALERAAYVDPMTGHRNLNKFVLDTGEQIARDAPAEFSVVYLNIKGFTYINDIFGRETGDQLIRYWADFIDACTLEGEIHGRVGVDAFALFCPQYCDDDTTSQRYRHVRAHLANFPPLASRGYTVDVYAGIYRFNPEDGALTVADMLDRAALAEQVARRARSSKVGYFTSEMRQRWRFEADVESHLETALQNREFEIYLQPKVDIQHGYGIVGMEALARWNRDGDMLSPSTFIPVLEKTGSIYKLDRHIFEAACKFYHDNGLASLDRPPVIGVNVSRAGLLQPDFLDAYHAIKRRYSIPDHCIELEFTETVAMDDRNQLPQIVDRCHEMGFLCSMDDFGAGYSSLNVLKSIRVDVLKLDAEFFRYGDDHDRGRVMVESIITMASMMGIKTVAEGIETRAEVELLREMGCSTVQGYVFAKPMPEADFVSLYMRTIADAVPEIQCAVS